MEPGASEVYSLSRWRVGPYEAWRMRARQTSHHLRTELLARLKYSPPPSFPYNLHGLDVSRSKLHTKPTSEAGPGFRFTDSQTLLSFSASKMALWLQYCPRAVIPRHLRRVRPGRRRSISGRSVSARFKSL